MIYTEIVELHKYDPQKPGGESNLTLEGINACLDKSVEMKQICKQCPLYILKKCSGITGNGEAHAQTNLPLSETNWKDALSFLGALCASNIQIPKSS